MNKRYFKKICNSEFKVISFDHQVSVDMCVDDDGSISN